jgi:predicted enzyme related to lactoylglutathione lyase
VQVLDKTESSEYGDFGWIIDPDGNKIELWQPPVGC